MGFALLAESADGERVMPFGETLAFVIGDKRAVIPLRRLQPERAIEEDLARGGLEEVGSANDFRDAHGGVVNDAGKLVGGHVIAPPDEEVSEIGSSDEMLETEVVVVEGDGLAVRNSETPVVAGRRIGQGQRVKVGGAAGSGVVGFVVGFVGRRGGECEFAA